MKTNDVVTRNPSERKWRYFCLVSISVALFFAQSFQAFAQDNQENRPIITLITPADIKKGSVHLGAGETNVYVNFKFSERMLHEANLKHVPANPLPIAGANNTRTVGKFAGMLTEDGKPVGMVMIFETKQKATEARFLLEGNVLPKK